jgi:hypothetical protein
MAFESKSYPGYVTEKICDIYKSNTVPIYWGTPDVVKDFNPTTFINANDFSNFDELIKYIKKVDKNDNLYAQYFVEPVLKDQWIDVLTTPGKPFFKNLADKIIGKKDNLFDKYINNLQTVTNREAVTNTETNIDNVKKNKDLWIFYAYNGHNYNVLEDYIKSLNQKYNIVYTYTPFKTTEKLSNLYNKIISEISPGSILIENKNAGLGLHGILTELEGIKKIQIDDIVVFQKI